MKLIFRFVRLLMSCPGRFPKTAATIFVLSSFLFLQGLNAQQWLDNIRTGNRNFYSIQKSFYKYHDSIETVKKDKRDPDEKEEDEEEDEGEFSKFKRWEWFMQPRVFPSGDRRCLRHGGFALWRFRFSSKATQLRLEELCLPMNG